MLCVSCKLCVFTSTGPCYVGRNYTGLVVCCHWPWSPELPAPAWTVDAPVCTCRHRGQVSFLPYLFYYLIIIQGYCYWVKANSTGKSWQNTVGIRPSDLCLLQIKAAQIFWGLILTLNVFGWILIWRNLILSILFDLTFGSACQHFLISSAKLTGQLVGMVSLCITRNKHKTRSSLKSSENNNTRNKQWRSFTLFIVSLIFAIASTEKKTVFCAYWCLFKTFSGVLCAQVQNGMFYPAL